MSNNENKNIWIFAEQQNGKFMNVVFELLGEGNRLAEEITDECKVCAVLIGHNVDHQVDELYSYGADIVYLYDNEAFAHYNGEGYAQILTSAVKQYSPEIVLFGATSAGNELAARVSSDLKTGLASNCTKLDIDNANYLDYLKDNADMDINNVDINAGNDILKQTRPGEDELMTTVITPDTKPQMATVNTGVVDRLEKDDSKRGEIIKLIGDIKKDSLPVSLIESIKKIKTKISLTDADIICAAGRGLGEAEGFKLIEEFADKVGGAVGASRFAVDSGWISYDHQVGQSATYVSPKIYFACGISGALQHVVAIQGSDVIVAINKNPDAPIMEIADFAIVGDLYKVIPEIIEIWDEFK